MDAQFKPARSSVVTAPQPILLPSQLLAAVRVLDHDGDGTIPVTTFRLDPDSKQIKHLRITKPVRILNDRQVREIQALTATPWRTHIELRSTGDGWIEFTDPETGEVDAIRASDAPYVWFKRTR